MTKADPMANEDEAPDHTLDPCIEVTLDPQRELEAVLDDLEALLKSGEVIGALTGRGINASLALLAAGGLRAYVAGKKADAADDLATAADEIRGRIQAGSAGHQA
jgi:hypothetical protein